MDATKRKRLEAQGWRFGTVAELLGLTPSESAEIERRLARDDERRARRRAPKR